MSQVTNITNLTMIPMLPINVTTLKLYSRDMWTSSDTEHDAEPNKKSRRVGQFSLSGEYLD